MPRDIRHSGLQNIKIGISDELICIVVAIDESNNTIIKVVGSSASSNMIEKALGVKICKNSILVTDSKNSYIKFAKDNNLILKQIPDGKYSVDGKYNLSEINELILEIENYITYSKKGISSKYLQLKKIIEENERLKNQNNKNSNNSSKPSSTNTVTLKKKTGANLYNYRVKTGNSKGGQYNHK